MTRLRPIAWVVVLGVVSTAEAIGGGSTALDGYLGGPDLKVDELYSTGIGKYILLAEPETPAKLIEYLMDSGPNPYKKEAILALRTLMLVEPDTLPFDRLRQYVESLEATWRSGDDAGFGILAMAYKAVAVHGGKESLAFLKERAEADFWRGRMIPWTGNRGVAGDTRVFSSRAAAIEALGGSRSESTRRWLEAFLERPDVAGDSELLIAAGVALQLHPFAAGDHRYFRQFVELRRRGFKVTEENIVVFRDGSEWKQAAEFLDEFSEHASDAIADTEPVASSKAEDWNETWLIVAAVVVIAFGTGWYSWRKAG